MQVLQKAKENNCRARWWIKADACDLRKGLRESMRGIWEGDEDFGDDSVQQMYGEYNSRRAFVKSLESGKRKESFGEDLKKVKDELCTDIEFLTVENERTNKIYNKVLEKSNAGEKKVMEAGWDAVEYQELLRRAKDLKNDVEGNGVDLNLGAFKLKFQDYLRGLFLKKRIPAKYLLVFMIADELRSKKPYAVPVQFVPYKSITDSKLIELETKLQKVMEENGMPVVGK